MNEVTVNIYPSMVDNYADIFSSIPEWTNRLVNLVNKYPDRVSMETITLSSVVVRLPASWIKIAPEEKEAGDGLV